MSNGKTLQGLAGEAITKFRAVRYDATGEIFQYNEVATGILGCGVACETVADAASVTFVYEGSATAEAGGAIEPGDYLTVDGSTGKFVVAASTNAVLGQWHPATTNGALHADLADGDIFEMTVFGNKSFVKA